MARVLSEILGPVNDVALAAKIVDSVGDALRVYVFLGAGAEVFLCSHAKRVLDTIFEHCSRLLAQYRVLVMIGLEILLPGVLDKGSHFTFTEAVSEICLV